jgi:hypothetical protein
MLKRVLYGLLAAVLLAGAALAVWYYPYRLDYGDVKNGVYRNGYFRLSLPVKGWYPVDMEKEKWRSEVMNDPAKAADKGLKRPPAWQRPNIHLVSVFDQAWVQPGEYNSSLFIFAEKRSLKPRTRDAEDYVKSVIADMLVDHKESSAPDALLLVKVNGKWAARMRVELKDPTGKVFRQEYYSIARRGYFLSFVLTWEKPEDRMRLQNLLDSLRFR